MPLARHVAVTFAPAACSDKGALVDPPEGGPYERECDTHAAAADPSWGPAVRRQASWESDLVAVERDEVLARIAVEWSYWIAGTHAHVGEVCLEIRDTPRSLSARPQLFVLPVEPNNEPTRLLLRLLVEITGPAREGKEHPRTLVERELVTRSSGVEVTVKQDPHVGFELYRSGGSVHLEARDHDVSDAAAPD
jgi:hypothetical protein